MSRAIHTRGTGEARRKAGEILRFGVALWLVFYLVYTPFHLYCVPHSDETQSSPSAPMAHAVALVDGGDHPEGGHRDHSANQHKLKALRSDRAACADVMLVPVTVWMEAKSERPGRELPGFSGLSPPELHRGWQFLFRAALPVRAPSFIS